jgi:hypothetical protein
MAVIDIRCLKILRVWIECIIRTISKVVAVGAVEQIFVFDEIWEFMRVPPEVVLLVVPGPVNLALDVFYFLVGGFFE